VVASWPPQISGSSAFIELPMADSVSCGRLGRSWSRFHETVFYE
jgi:hypothetical protein